MPGRTRRQFLLSGAALLATEAAVAAPNGDRTDRQRLREAADRGRRFLASLYDPSVSLLPEFRGSKTYWLYHDNYLAAKVLDRTDAAMAKKVRDGIRVFRLTGSGKIEILFDEATRPMPFRHYRLIEVARIGEKSIKTEVVTEEVNSAWRDYTDLLFVAAIVEARAVREQAVRYFVEGMATWDGTGFRDRVNRNGGRYATFKLALALFAGSRLDRHPDQEPAIVERLLAAQRHDGGFVTDYDDQRRPLGEANVETTSLAVIALDAVK